MSVSDSKYNRSEKGKARYARHREKTREQRRAYDRARMARLRLNPEFRAREEEYFRTQGYFVRRRRELGAQRKRLTEQLAGLEQIKAELIAELGFDPFSAA